MHVSFKERREPARGRKVLAEIGADNIPYLLLYNKIDAVPDFIPPPGSDGKFFAISALKRRGLDALRAELIARSQNNSPGKRANKAKVKADDCR